MKGPLPTVLVALLVSASATLAWAQTGIENLPWGVKRIRGDLPWDSDRNLIVDPVANAGEGITVAVLDSGIWSNHPDLAGRVVDGIYYVGGNWWEDPLGHGTHVAGTIAAIDNGNRLIGVAPKVTLLSVQVISSDGYVTEQNAINGIDWAANHGANIISMSFAFPSAPSEYLNLTCDDAYNSGALPIASSGNANIGLVDYPAKYESVIAVGAVDMDDERWMPTSTLGSNYGPELELAAPGQDINSTSSSSPPYYQLKSGTSHAVPHVTGTAALIWGSKVDGSYDSNENGQWDNFEVRTMLQDTALGLGSGGMGGYYGFGLVNAWQSLQRPEGDITRDEKVNILDLSWAGKHYGKDSSDPDWWLYIRPTDINIDNIVNIHDLSIIASNYGRIDP